MISKILDAWNLVEIQDPHLLDFSKQAYNWCVTWFGIPVDELWEYEILIASMSGCSRQKLFKYYTIYIDKRNKSIEQKMAIIAHEVYHRVTIPKNSLRRIVWVDEMVAFLVSDRILMMSGLEQYAEYRKQKILERCNNNNARGAQGTA